MILGFNTPVVGPVHAAEVAASAGSVADASEQEPLGLGLDQGALGSYPHCLGRVHVMQQSLSLELCSSQPETVKEM